MSKKKQIFLIVILLTLFIASLGIFNYYRNKRAEEIALNKQAELTKRNNELADEISSHYSSTLLPVKSVFFIKKKATFMSLREE